MSARRHIPTARTILAICLLGLLVWGAPPVRAGGAGDDKKPVKIPGLIDKDALDHFQFQPINVPVIRDGKVARILTVTIAMETKGDANKTKVMAQRYQLLDAFVRDIHGVASFARVDGRIIDLGVVKTRLQAISDRLLGEGIVEDVLVVSIFDRGFS
jgi:hypothetical protein